MPNHHTYKDGIPHPFLNLPASGEPITSDDAEDILGDVLKHLAALTACIRYGALSADMEGERDKLKDALDVLMHYSEAASAILSKKAEANKLDNPGKESL